MVKLLLLLNKLFPPRQHPFNMEGAEKLNYYNFEYESSEDVFGGFSILLDKPISKIVEDKLVLDLGCGAGGKSVYLYEQGAKKVNAIDLSEVLIEQGKKYINDKGLSDNVVLSLGDVTDLDFEDNSFDILVANDLMEHVNYPEEMLDEVYRVLKPGGLILINFEPYYHFLGHHMWDKINIPWAHVFFSEKTRIEAYRELVQNLPDGEERLSFRLSKRENGEEYIGYLNHITYEKYVRMIHDSNFHVERNRALVIKESLLKPLRKIPYLRELFIRKVITVLKK